MGAEYRIVFSGQIRPGLSLQKVKAHAGQRLGVSDDHLERMFSGRPVVLKNRLTMEAGEAYAERLEQLGLLVRIERMPAAKLASSAATAPVESPATVPVPARAAVPVKPDAQPSPEDTWLTSSSFANLARTHLNLARAEALLNGAESVDALPEAGNYPAWPALNAPPVEPAPAATSAAAEPLPLALAARSAQEVAPGVQGLSVQGTFLCSHCGTLHHLQTRLELSSQGIERAA